MEWTNPEEMFSMVDHFMIYFKSSRDRNYSSVKVDSLPNQDTYLVKIISLLNKY